MTLPTATADTQRRVPTERHETGRRGAPDGAANAPSGAKELIRDDVEVVPTEITKTTQRPYHVPPRSAALRSFFCQCLIFSPIQEKINGNDINHPAKTNNQELHFAFMDGEEFFFPVKDGFCCWSWTV
jgi:hypothetical protein